MLSKGGRKLHQGATQWAPWALSKSERQKGLQYGRPGTLCKTKSARIKHCGLYTVRAIVMLMHGVERNMPITKRTPTREKQRERERDKESEIKSERDKDK